MSVIETVTFRLAPEVDEAGFLEADRRAQTEFAYQQPGLLRRTAARGQDGDWIVIVLWRSERDANAAAARSGSHPATSDLEALLDRTSVRRHRYAALD